MSNNSKLANGGSGLIVAFLTIQILSAIISRLIYSGILCDTPWHESPVAIWGTCLLHCIVACTYVLPAIAIKGTGLKITFIIITALYACALIATNVLTSIQMMGNIY